MLYEPSEENTAFCVKHETSAQRETRGEKKCSSRAFRVRLAWLIKRLFCRLHSKFLYK